MANATERIIGIVLTLGLFLVILELVRRRRLMERYALLWLFASIVLLVLAAWRGLLSTLAHNVGIHYPPSALFLVAIGLGLVLAVHFSLAISRLSDQNKVLAQRLAILQHRLETHQAAQDADSLEEVTAVDAGSDRDQSRPHAEQPLSSAR